MSVDCVCCESLDIANIDLIYLISNKYLLPNEIIISNTIFHNHNVKSSLTNSVKVRAPPLV